MYSFIKIILFILISPAFSFISFYSFFLLYPPSFHPNCFGSGKVVVFLYRLVMLSYLLRAFRYSFPIFLLPLIPLLLFPYIILIFKINLLSIVYRMSPFYFDFISHYSTLTFLECIYYRLWCICSRIYGLRSICSVSVVICVNLISCPSYQ